MTSDERINTIKVLRKEVEILTLRIRERGTGHIHTAIGVLNERIDKLIEEGIMKEKYGRAVETIHVGLEELG